METSEDDHSAARRSCIMLVNDRGSGVYTVNMHPFTCGAVERKGEQQAKAYLKRMAGRLNEQGIETSTAVWTGSVAESIVKYADTGQIDLIAMCTHGRTGLARWALGSVADRILRAASIPILLVRAS